MGVAFRGGRGGVPRPPWVPWGVCARWDSLDFDAKLIHFGDFSPNLEAEGKGKRRREKGERKGKGKGEARGGPGKVCEEAQSLDRQG